MEHEFQYLIHKYTLAGAREKFENICADLLRTQFGDSVHQIRPCPGDDGIDVMIGDFSSKIHNYQCKFFPNGIGEKQKDQIRKSFRSAIQQTRYTMREWTLCVPCNLSPAERTWWDTWRQDQEQQTGIPISLLDGGRLLKLLKDHDLYDEVFDIRINTILEELHDALCDHGIGHIATVLTPRMIADAYADCDNSDIKAYYAVDNSFQTMLRVICKGEDIPCDGAPQAVMDRCLSGDPVIITGNSGTGKSSLMLRTAVEWVRAGSPAVWLSLSADDCVTGAATAAFYRNLQKLVSGDRRLLLCIDDPYDGKTSLANLQKYWPRDRRLQLLMSERRNRLDQLADENEDHLRRWFDQASVVVLEGTSQIHKAYQLSDYPCEHFYESYIRRTRVLEKCVSFYDPAAIAQIPQILKDFGKPTVSLVELLYRTLFKLKTDAALRTSTGFGSRAPKNVSKSADIRLDWDEWRTLMRKRFGKGHEAQDSYGMIAACNFFNTPIGVSFFCKYFDLKEHVLLNALEDLRLSRHIEPVIYLKGPNALRPKHEVAAELYFLFHPRRSINAEMEQLLDAMNEYEIDALLQNMVVKWELQNSRKQRISRIDYRGYLQRIYERHRRGTLNLLPESLARLCLGLLWSIPRDDRTGQKRDVLKYFAELAPPIDDSLIMAILYTEWGKLLSDERQPILAEEKLRAVADRFPTQLHARTELGRLLAKQPGRELEAERFLKEILDRDSRNIQARTELGRLLAKQPGRELEAERFLKEILDFDSQNLQARTELGRLLAKQPGREREAEQFLREAMEIDLKHLQSRTELSRLLAKQPGRELEAERFLKEILDLDSRNIQSRTELGRLLAKQPGREREAEQFLREAMEIDPKHIQSRTELGRLLAKQPGRECEAEQFLREAFQIDRKNLHSRIVLASLCIQQNRPDEAERLYREVLKLNPNDSYATNGLSRINKLP